MEQTQTFRQRWNDHFKTHIATSNNSKTWYHFFNDLTNEELKAMYTKTQSCKAKNTSSASTKTKNTIEQDMDNMKFVQCAGAVVCPGFSREFLLAIKDEEDVNFIRTYNAYTSLLQCTTKFFR
eukprot:Awhi_evm1s1983